MTLPVRGVDSPTTLTRWDPYREMEDAWSRMGSLLGDVMGGVGGTMIGGMEGRPGRALGRLMTPVDIEETDDAYIIELDLPGVRREDVDVELRENEILVMGEIKERQRTGVVRRQSRPVGRFEHRISIRGDVDPDSVKASLSNGVLMIRLAKTTRGQARHIEVSEVVDSSNGGSRRRG